MNRPMNRPQLLVIVFILIVSSFAFSQKKSVPSHDETKAEVPALNNFHEVIHKIWHTAWPAKNVVMLAGLAPDLRTFGDSLSKADLPGILHEKKSKWEEQVVTLQSLITEYQQASSPIDSQKLLSVAERLHAQYEQLAGLVHPALKELGEFHSVLYMLYHTYLPDSSTENISSSVKELKVKMKALNKAKLPERMKNNEDAFLKARTKLSQSVDAAATALKSGDMKSIRASIEILHTDYQTLEKIFD